MKLTMPRDVLTAVTTWANAAAAPAAPAPLPVLAGIMLTAAEGTLTADRFGYGASATASAAAEVGEPGRVLVYARMLAEVAAALPARQPVDLAFDGTRVTLAAGTVRYTLLALPADQYPEIPAEPSQHAAEFDPKALAAAIGIAALAAGKDDTLPALTCVRLVLDGKGTATLTTTDRYRAAVVTCPCTPGPAARTTRARTAALIPARELSAAVKRPGTGPVRLALGDGSASLASDGRHVTIRQLDAEFPAVAKLAPAPKDITVAAVANVAALAAAVKRAAVVAERNTPARFGFTADGVRVESGTGDEAQLAETVPLEGLDGDPIAIAFNPAYLLDALAAVAATGSATARIAMTTPTRPALITPAKPETAADDDVSYLLMPVRSAG
jgi:DNA polymerase III subunit beta